MVKSFIQYQQANNNKILFIYILLYICFVQISYSLGQDSNYVQLYDEKGIISSEGYLVNNLPEGEWISYYSNGQIKSKGSWKANQLNGEWVFYNINGNLINEEPYI